MSLAFLLDEQYRLLGEKIVGKRILLASYGSGNTMAIISAVVAKSAPSVLARWRLANLWQTAKPVGMSEYERWLGAPYDRERYAELVESCAKMPAETFYLSAIREDGYREYRHT